MGLFDDKAKLDAIFNQPKKYPYCVVDLNEGEVQAVFNRCLAKDGTPKGNVSGSILFSRTLGYKPEDEVVFYFDKEKLLANKKNIQYLYGQLRSVHQKKEDMCLDDAWYNYSGKRWTTDRACLLYLLYLGCTQETLLISPFSTEAFRKYCEDENYDAYLKNLGTVSAKDTTVLAVENLAPTISPKDPNFPAWWAAHKAEWER